MPINQDTYNKNLYDLLSVKYDVTPINSKGQTTPVPQEADVFRFEFVKDGKNYGDVWVTIDSGKNLIVYYDDQVADSGDDNTSGTPIPDTWTHLIKQLKHWARNNLLGFELKNRNHLSKDMAQREHMKKKEQLGEGYYPMGKNKSYSDNIPQVKIVLQHTRQIEEGEQRFRNIAKIFVENINGERFAIPTNRPGLARVYARHIAEGGTPYDDKGKHITSLVEEYTKMAGFVRATKGNQFNEDAQKLVDVGINHYKTLKETLTRMVTARGYNKYFESWTPVLNEESDNDESLNELFVRETLDPRIESVMPILSKLRKQVTEMDEVKSLEEWADNMISEKLEVESSTNESTRKHFKQVADVIAQHPHSHKRKELAKHHADIFAQQNARFDRKRFFKAAKADDETVSEISDPKKKDESLDEERQDLYLVVDKKNPGNAVGIWDGHVFKPFDKTKFSAGVMDMIPSQYMVDKSAGPATSKQIGMAQVKEAPGAETLAHNQDTEEKNLKAFDLAEVSADDIDEGKNVKYFYVTVDGKEKFKTKNEMEARNTAEEMKTDPSFDGKTIDVITKNDYEVQINEKGVAEDLDANQKRAGQLGPTEPVGKNEKNLRGKLVGASESTETKEEAITEMDSEGHRGHREDGDPYAKGAKATPAKAKDVAKKGAKDLDKAFNKTHDKKKDVKEGQEDLEAILRIVRK